MTHIEATADPSVASGGYQSIANIQKQRASKLKWEYFSERVYKD